MDNTGIFGNAYDDEDLEEEVDMNNVDTSYTASDAPFTKFLKDHPQEQVIRSLKTPVQTRHMTKINEEHGLFSSVHKLRRIVQHKSEGIFISQDKYVAEILKKFDFATVKTASTPMEPNKALINMKRLKIDSPFDLEAFFDNDYAGASLDRKSTKGDETVYKERGDRMERVATTASILEGK
ncbi:hypothetical protein Tco_0932996 [Tanacetum coccineum]